MATAELAVFVFHVLCSIAGWNLKRDAIVVLDEVLDNETELSLFQHATDTAGFTEIIFGLFDLLGYQFTHRLRDVSAQTPDQN